MTIATLERLAAIASPTPVPSRASGSLTLGVGTSAIKMSLYSGIEDTSFSRTEWIENPDGTFSSVGRQPAVKNDDGTYGRVVDYDQIVKRADVGGTLVTITDAEIAQARGFDTDGDARIVAFQPLGVLNSGAYLPDGVMQLRPARRQVGRSTQVDRLSERAFALLVYAMRRHGVFAMVEYALRGQVRYGALLPTGRFLSLRFDDEVRSDLPLPAVCNFSDTEKEQADALVAGYTNRDVISLINTVKESVLSYAATKVAPGQTEVTATAAAPATTTRSSECVASIMNDLAANIAAAATANP